MASEPAPNGGPTRFDRAAEIFHEVRALGLVERQALAIMDHPTSRRCSTAAPPKAADRAS